MRSATTSAIIKAATPGELAAAYEVSVRTFNSWLKPFSHRLGPRSSKFFTIMQVKLIYQLIGIPNSVAE